MFQAYTGKTSTALRENWKKELSYLSGSAEITRTEINGVQKISKIITRRAEVFSDPVCCILENARPAGDVLDFSGNENDFDAHGFTGDSIREADYFALDGLTRILSARFAGAEPAPHLCFDGASYLKSQSDTVFSAKEELSIGMILCDLSDPETETTQTVFCRPGSGGFSLVLNSDKTLTFEVEWDGTEYSVTSTNTLPNKQPKEVVCRWDRTETIDICVDGTWTEQAVSSATASPAQTDNYLYIGSDGTADTSVYLQSGIHCFWIDHAFLSDFDIEDLWEERDFLGADVDILEYDDSAGTETGTPYAFWRTISRSPGFEYIRTIEKQTTPEAWMEVLS